MQAGIIGSFPALNARPPELLDEWLTKIKADLILTLTLTLTLAWTGTEEATAACTRLGRVTRNQPASIPGYEPPKATHLFAGVSSQRRTA